MKNRLLPLLSVAQMFVAAAGVSAKENTKSPTAPDRYTQELNEQYEASMNPEFRRRMGPLEAPFITATTVQGACTTGLLEKYIDDKPLSDLICGAMERVINLDTTDPLNHAIHGPQTRVELMMKIIKPAMRSAQGYGASEITFWAVLAKSLGANITEAEQAVAVESIAKNNTFKLALNGPNTAFGVLKGTHVWCTPEKMSEIQQYILTTDLSNGLSNDQTKEIISVLKKESPKPAPVQNAPEKTPEPEAEPAPPLAEAAPATAANEQQPKVYSMAVESKTVAMQASTTSWSTSTSVTQAEPLIELAAVRDAPLPKIENQGPHHTDQWGWANRTEITNTGR